MKKICILGDSISKGIILDSSFKYRQLSECCVNLFSYKEGYDINNMSLFGCTITKGMQIFSRRHEKIAESDIVVTEFGGNDCDFDWQAISDNPDGVFSPKTTIENFTEEYKKILELLIKEGKKVFVINLPPLEDEKYFNWICREKNRDNILRWLGGNTKYIYRWHEMYNDAVCNVAKMMNVELIDIRSEFLKLRDYAKYLCEDGIHPNELGHKLIYDTLSKKYKAYIMP